MGVKYIGPKIIQLDPGDNIPNAVDLARGLCLDTKAKVEIPDASGRSYVLTYIEAGISTSVEAWAGVRETPDTQF